MDIFNYGEHTHCPNYPSAERVCFKYMEVENGAHFSVKLKRDKHIFFFLEGRVKVSYNEFSSTIFNAGEMIFLPKSADCKGVSLTKCKFIVLIYDNAMKFCEKQTIDLIIQHAQNVKYAFQSLPIGKETMAYLLLLKRYLQDGINCGHLHEIKQKELFLLFRAYYKKDDLAQFFFPMIGKTMGLRDKVMAYYPSVRSVKELATACRYSKSHFNDLFVEEFGDSPYQWMQKQKSKHVIGRLSDTTVPIKEIVDEFNFTSPSHFHKYCIKQFGVTPTQFREKKTT